MEVETILFGKMKIPDDKESIVKELDRCKNRFLESPTRYLQARIDELEYTLVAFRRSDNV